MIKLSEIESKYGEYLVDEDKLKELLVKPKPKTIWNLEPGEIYYYISAIGDVCSILWIGNDFDEARIEFSNAFLTKEEAEFELERKNCEDIMLKYGRRTFKHNKKNYFILFDYSEASVAIDYCFTNFAQGCIYFDSEELVQIAINEIGVERLKKYIFRVEE